MTIMGFLLALMKNFFFVGYSIIEALVFMIAFNYLAPFISDKLYELPVVDLKYLQCLALFILIHFVCQFIHRLTPKLVSVNNTNKKE